MVLSGIPHKTFWSVEKSEAKRGRNGNQVSVFELQVLSNWLLRNKGKCLAGSLQWFNHCFITSMGRSGAGLSDFPV